MTLKKTLCVVALSSALTFSLAALPDGARAQEAKTVATVNGEAITVRDMAAAEVELGQALGQMEDKERLDYVLTFLIDMKLMAAEGKRRGAEAKPGFNERIKFLRERVLMQSVLAEEAAKGVTDAAMQEFYDEAIGRVPPEEELNARHILLETEDEAKAILAEIKNGADFAEMAKEHSTGPSGPKGGDLGYFRNGQMVPEFQAAASALDVGAVSEPVKTQFGWHLIKLEDKRQVEPPAFDTVKDQIRDAVMRQAQSEFISGLREAAAIERTPVGDAAAPADTAQ